MQSFFWVFLVISEPGSRISIVSDFYFFIVSLDFLHEITLKAVDIDNNGCLEAFLPL